MYVGIYGSMNIKPTYSIQNIMERSIYKIKLNPFKTKKDMIQSTLNFERIHSFQTHQLVFAPFDVEISSLI